MFVMKVLCAVIALTTTATTETALQTTINSISAGTASTTPNSTSLFTRSNSTRNSTTVSISNTTHETRLTPNVTTMPKGASIRINSTSLPSTTTKSSSTTSTTLTTPITTPSSSSTQKSTTTKSATSTPNSTVTTFVTNTSSVSTRSTTALSTKSTTSTAVITATISRNQTPKSSSKNTSSEVSTNKPTALNKKQTTMALANGTTKASSPTIGLSSNLSTAINVKHSTKLGTTISPVGGFNTSTTTEKSKQSTQNKSTFTGPTTKIAVPSITTTNRAPRPTSPRTTTVMSGVPHVDPVAGEHTGNELAGDHKETNNNTATITMSVDKSTGRTTVRNIEHNHSTTLPSGANNGAVTITACVVLSCCLKVLITSLINPFPYNSWF